MAKSKFQTTSSSYESVLKQASTEKVSFFSISKIYPAYITLIVTLGVTFGLWQLADSQVESEINTSFDKAVTSVMTRFESEYGKNDQVLTSVSGLYDNLVQVVKDYFDLYASIPTKTLESLTGVIYVPRVYSENLEWYYYNTRSQGLWEYIITPEGSRDTYYPVQFMVPAEKNEHLSGFDFGTIPLVKSELLSSMKSKNTVATPVFQFRKDTSAFFLIGPVYKKDAPIKTEKDKEYYYEGAVILEIDSDIFFKNSLGTGNQSDSTIIFQVYNASKDKEIVFESENVALLKEDYEPDLTDERILKIADKEINVKFYTVPGYGGTLTKYAPIITLVVSLLLSGLAFAFIVNVINRKQSALSLAERMTRSQRRIVESSNDIIAVLDLSGEWKSMNPASRKILQYEPDEMINHKIDTLFADETEKNDFFKILDEPSEELTRKIDVQLLAKSGEKKWVSFSLSVARIEGLVYITGRDVTLEKIAEEQDKIRNKQVLLAEQLSREASEFKTSFFAKLSLQLRNSLTGILGYLDLISFKAYETDDEHDTYIDEAAKSSREILNFVMDTSDNWGVSEAEGAEVDSLRIMTAIKLEKPVNEAVEKFKQTSKATAFDITVDDSIQNSIAVIDNLHFSSSVNELLTLIAEDVTEGAINISSKVFDEEDTTEFTLTAPSSLLFEEMISEFNSKHENLLDTLKFDKKDIILKLAIAESNFRMVHGTMGINTDNNQIIVSVKLQNKVQQEERAE